MRHGQAPEEIKVTYRTEGLSVRRVLDDLSNQSGKELIASQLYQGLPMVIGVQDVSLRDLMDSMTEICHGAWKEQDSLVRSDELDKKEATEPSVSAVPRLWFDQERAGTSRIKLYVSWLLSCP